MYNLGDDNELDRMSREAAGRYDPPGNANWQAINAELDRVMPQEKKKRKFLFWWLLPVVLAGGAITFQLIQKENQSTVSTEKITPIKEPGNVQTTPAIAPTGKAEDHTNETGIIADNKASQSLKGGLPGSNDLSNPLSFRAKEKKADAQNLSIQPKMADVAAVNPLIQQSIVIPEPAKVTTETLPANHVNEQKEAVKESKAETIRIDQLQQTQAVNPNPEKETASGITPADKKKAKSFATRGKGWSFSLLTGVDQSTVKFKYGYKPGINAGLMLGYHFNDKWAIKSGVIYTQKNYKLAGTDFTAPKGTWLSNYKLDEVEGYCRMWEVPLLVNYTIRKTNRKSINLAAGLSSYFMTKENYDYYYYYQSNPVSRNASYNSTDTHILSVAHLSAGFESRLSKNISLQIEPYAKIPLGGLGYGNIKLSSFGINFSVQYKQPAKK